LIKMFKLPFNAITLLNGFIIAESAVIGRLIGLFESAISMIITKAVSLTFSRTQINLSDSIVSELNPIFVTLIPTFCSYK
jgi:hypothetical protein